MEDLQFNGTKVFWLGKGFFKASTGMPGYQYPKYQCLKDKGPVPEGQYYIPLIEGDKAKDDGTGICRLEPSWQIQRIPRGEDAGVCEPYWANWGINRVRFEPADIATKSKCSPIRGGFYLHDSIKGFSRGCIEVERSFFDILRATLKLTDKKKLILKVQYIPGKQTYGGTRA